MVGARLDLCRFACALGAGFVLGLAADARVCGQEQIPPGIASPIPPANPNGPASSMPPSADTGTMEPVPQQQQVVDVRVEGHKNLLLSKITQHIRTRAGRPFDSEMLQEDVRRLGKSQLLLDVTTEIRSAPAGGLIVIFHVIERPTLRYVKYIGNTIAERHLVKKTNLKKGDPFDPDAVEEGRRKLEEYYILKGFTRATITIIEGNKHTDRGAVYLINEGQKQKIWNVKFIGNSIASDGRLKTQIDSKPPFLLLFKGEVDRLRIEEDVERLKDYYRGLGFFRARIGREMEFNKKQNWMTLTFVIDEGPRYLVRSVSFIGNKKFSSDYLTEELKLKNNEYFNKAAMDKDKIAIQDQYGTQGFLFANVEPDIRFGEEPGQLDLIYQIEEGSPHRIGRIDIDIQGDNPHTRRNTILNRLSIHPGDIADIRKIRESERLLKFSALFMHDPAQGIEPRLTFTRPEMGDESSYAERDTPSPRGFRGQSPDDHRAAQPSDSPSSARPLSRHTSTPNGLPSRRTDLNSMRQNSPQERRPGPTSWQEVR